MYVCMYVIRATIWMYVSLMCFVNDHEEEQNVEARHLEL